MPAEKYQIITAIVVVIILFLIAGFFILVLVTYINQRKKKYVEEKLKMQTQFRHELLQTQLEIQEQTFKNISQEIHDNIGQALSLAKLNINTMNYDEPELLQNKIADSKHLISKAIQDLRDLSKSLNTDYVTELGLLRAIEYELEIIQRTGSFTIQFEVKGNRHRLEPQQELIIFRIVQEALHNIIKHSKAKTIYVEADFAPHAFSLSIKDDGVGFDSSHLAATNYEGMGLGLRNMHNRAGMILTNLKVISQPGEGASVLLSLPITNHKIVNDV